MNLLAALLLILAVYGAALLVRREWRVLKQQRKHRRQVKPQRLADVLKFTARKEI